MFGGGFNDFFNTFLGALHIGSGKVGDSLSYVRLLGAIAMLAQTLQIEKLIAAAVFLRDDVINIGVRLPNFFAALGAGVPAVIRFVMLKPFFPVAQKFSSSKTFYELYKEICAV